MGALPDAKTEGRGRADPSREAITIVALGAYYSFPDGYDENHNPYLDFIESRTGLDVTVKLPLEDGYNEQLNVIMESSKMPDLVNTTSNAWVADYVKRNALLPLDDYIDRYGPDLKKRIPPEAWDLVRFEGSIYAVPSLNSVRGNEIMYVRKDWLDRLGLQPPRTIAEYAEVMRRFARDDPDGNGRNDTVGLLIGSGLVRTAPLLGAFGTQMNAWYEREGKLVYSGVLPETKEALRFMADLYREGAIDPEFPLNKLASLEEKIVNGRAGLFSAVWYDTRGPIEASRKADPKAEWIPLDYPVGPDGRHGVADNAVARMFNVVPATSKHPEAVVKLLNFIVGDGYKTLNLGFENQVWTRRGDKLVTNFEEHNRQSYRGIYGALADAADPAVDRERLDSLGVQFRLSDNLERISQNLIRNRFNGPPTPAMTMHGANLLAMQESAFTRIVTGVDPLDAFDRFAERWYREGGRDMTDEANEWFAKRTAYGGGR
ncbi:peptide permease [Paenibacillus flagellatus]|uniref:Peptide permease n=2 Tax=Paenibacillus flagellatus TaxID=2211139 RepID=A0A2V5KD49_9BACL|nr:peptide permease [Paenibacillus flagellatus]